MADAPDPQVAIRAAYGLANQVMLRWLVHHVHEHGPLPEAKLAQLTKRKNELLAEHRLLLADGDPEATYRRFAQQFRRVADEIAGVPREEKSTC